MYNQNWHPVTGPEKVLDSVSPDTQVTDPWQTVFRMSGESTWPGAEIVVYCYGEYDDPNGQREDGSWPDIVVTAMIAYEIREGGGNDPEYGEVTDSDYEYQVGEAVYKDAAAADNAAKLLAMSFANLGDWGWDWNGECVMYRTGGPVSHEAH